MSLAFYNEIDCYAAKWLRNLIDAGHICPGVVDERSIEDIHPDELRGFTQCHFFAGVGVWSLALRRAGWPDDRPVWTGSAPCQPFSAAGEGLAFADERHLWPAMHHLIKAHAEWCREQKRPIPTIFGEQVASKTVDAWIDLVHADLEAVGYTFGSVPFPSAGVGAPHIRDRNYWVGHASGTGLEGHAGNGGAAGRQGPRRPVTKASVSVRLADATGERWGGRPTDSEESAGRGGVENNSTISCELPGPTNGFWRDADWLGCTDGKWRPVEPGTFPLAHGAAARVGRLRAYGNAINAEAARVWIESVMESI